MEHSNDNTRWWQNPSWIAALSALLIGVSALAVSLYQAYLMHQQQRMSVWPYLALAHSNANGRYAYTLSNEGVGPARIRYIDVLYKDEAMTNWNQLLSKTYTGEATVGSYSYLSRRVVPMNTTIEAFQLPLGDAAKAFRLAAADTRIEMCYCSIYDDCYFYVNADTVTVEPVSTCPENRPHIFRN